MLKLLLPASIGILMALLACTTATPVPSPTAAPAQRDAAATPALQPDTPVPEATATPASSPEPATTERPTATPAVPATPTPPGVLAPLPLQDPQALLSELSDAEVDCIGGDAEKLARSLPPPNTAPAEELGEFIQCLDDETLARIFLAGFVPGTEPLSLESSACVRAAFDVIKPRKVMTAGLEGDPGAAMAGSMAALTVTIACLNDEEWEAAAPGLGMRLEERAGMQCLMAALDGPREMATAMRAAQEGDLTGLAKAGAECGLDMGPPPGQASTPVPLPTQVNQAPSQSQDIPALTDDQVARMKESISGDPILTVMLQGGYTINDYGPWVAGDRTFIGAIAEIFLTSPTDHQGSLPMVGFEPAEDGSKEYRSGTFNITATGIKSLIILVDIAEEAVVGIEIGESDTFTLSADGE